MARVTDIQLCAKARIPRHRHWHPRRHPRGDVGVGVGVVECELNAMSRCIWSLLAWHAMSLCMDLATSMTSVCLSVCLSVMLMDCAQIVLEKWKWNVGVFVTGTRKPTWIVVPCDPKFYWGRPVGYEKCAVLHFGGNNLRNSYTLDPYRTHIRNRIWRIEWYHQPMAIESAQIRPNGSHVALS